MRTDFDVLIVGARCAGSPLAALLARGGARVGVVEKIAFPRDTLSTHIFQAAGINFLARLGVLDEVSATGAPFVSRVDLRNNDFGLVTSLPQRVGDRGMTMSVRRVLLDPILAGAAERAGAAMMMRTTVTGVIRHGDRVQGVRVSGEDGERVLRARLVVGADGRNSTVARQVAARKYHLVEGERFAYWGFFQGAAPESEPTIVYHRWDGRFVIAIAADSGLYQVVVLPDNTEAHRAQFRAGREAAFLEHVMACAPVARLLGCARRSGKLLGMMPITGYLRESAGPGWALAGDAGHFKDPAPGQGIGDAFRQAEALAPAILAGLQGADAGLDATVAAWARWRDRDAMPAHWMATDFGSAGPWPAVVPEMLRRLVRGGDTTSMLDVLQHRATQPEVFTPGRLAAATASLMLDPRGGDRREILREAGGLVAADVRRRKLAVRPVFADPPDRVDRVDGADRVDSGDPAESADPLAALA